MALQRDKIAAIATLNAAAASLYTNPTGVKAYVKGIILHNTNSTAETIELHNAPNNGGAMGAASLNNRFLRVSLVADETLFVDLSYPIVLSESGDALLGKSTTAGKVTVQLLGDKEV